MPVKVQGPDGKTYSMPDGTTKEKAVAYFKTKGIGASTPAQLEKRAMDPSSSYSPTTVSTGHTGTETPAGKAIETGGKALVGALPMVGGAVGAALGGMGAGPVGAVAGAAAGGAAGKNIENRFEGKDPHEGTVGAGAVQGATELIGGIAIPKMLEKIGAKAVPKVYKALSNYIGLKPSDLPKWGRTAEEADKITKAVLDEAGVKKTLEAQKNAIEAARAARDAETKQIVATPAGRLVDLDSKVIDTAVNWDRRIARGEFPEFKRDIVDENLKQMQDIIEEHGGSSGRMTPAQMHAMRKSISSQIRDWNPSTKDARQWFLQQIYHDLNSGIVEGLPQAEANAFKANNRVQSNLIVARDAAQEKLAGQRLASSQGIATKAVRGVVKPLAGAMVGGAVGGAAEGKRGAVGGALIGAGMGTVAEKLGAAELPAMDVRAQQAIARAAPYLAKVTKKAAPTGARAVQATINAIQSRPQNQP